MPQFVKSIVRASFVVLFVGSSTFALGACGDDSSVVGGPDDWNQSRGLSDDHPLATTVEGIVVPGTITITGTTGTLWHEIFGSHTTPCSTRGVEGYFRVPYLGADAIGLTLSGTNLTAVTSVSIVNPLTNMPYSVAITRQSASLLGLDIRALSEGPGGSQPMTLIVALRTTSGATVLRNINVIPTYSVAGQSFGQCTWLAWWRSAGRVRSYSAGQTMSADPGSNLFPRAGDVVMSPGFHMAVVGAISLRSSTPTRREYAVTIEEANADCRGSVRTVNVTAVVSKSASGAWSWTTRPTTVCAFTQIAR